MGWMFGTTGGVVGDEGGAVGVDTDGVVSCDGNESGTMMACDAVVGSGEVRHSPDPPAVGFHSFPQQ